MLWWGFRGFYLTQTSSMLLGTHLGVVIGPKYCFCCLFPLDFPFSWEVEAGSCLLPGSSSYFSVFYRAWALARVGGMAEGLTN